MDVLVTEIFDLSKLGAAERTITAEAIARCEFEWGRLLPGLRAARGKDRIPVEWTDLSRMASEAKSAHEHVHDEHGDVGHPIVHYAAEQGVPYRKRTLGLAWYSGKVSIDSSLLASPTLAGEVFLAEGAHMLDFFWLVEEQRRELIDLLHGTESGAQTAEHGHTWFDNPDYFSDVGEAFMGLFVRAFSDYPVTLTGFKHRVTEEMARSARDLLQPRAYGRRRSKVFHLTTHAWMLGAAENWRSSDAAQRAGRRYCRLCTRRRPLA
jgi:hypothetical protein